MNKFGNTSSSIAFATQVAIEHNIKVLLISTSFKDSIIKDSFWQEQKKRTFGIFSGNNRSSIDNNGVEGLDRVIRRDRKSVV